MGGKARAAAKKAEREAEKRQARKRTEEALKATATATPSSEKHGERPSTIDSALGSSSTKKCPHVKSGIKLKRLSTAACAAFSGSPATCGESPCRSNRSSKTALWFCLCCMRLVCQPDLGAHDHPTFIHFPLSSPTAAYSSRDLESAIANGSVRFACTECSAELVTPKNPLLLDALSTIRKRLESLSFSDKSERTRDDMSLDFSPFAAPPASSSAATATSSSKRLSGALKPHEYLGLGMHGLTNLGNTCYAASLLQVLTHARHLPVPAVADCDDMDLLSSAFYAFLRDMHSQVGSPALHPGGLLSELGRRFREFRSFSRQNDAHEMMRCLFDVVDTEHGKRVKALRQLEEEEERLNEDEGKDRGESPGEDQAKEDPSPVARAFRSELVSYIKCLSCGTVQTVPEPFFDLSLVMSTSLASSLAQFFAQDQVLYSCEEEACLSTQQPLAVQDEEPNTPDSDSADGSDDDEDADADRQDPWAHEGDSGDEDAGTQDDASTAAKHASGDPNSDNDETDQPIDDDPNCNPPSPPLPPPKRSVPPTAHSKRYVIKSLAPTLCFQLKRTARSKKTKLDFPPHLSLRESDPEANATCDPSLGTQPGPSPTAHYELFGVVEHTGSMNFGHYTAYVRVHQPLIAANVRGTWEAHPSVGAGAGHAVWLHANDARVTQVTESQVLHSNPYLLFYQRVRK